MSSLGKKYLMALSGFILAGFVFGHMAGNLQVFLDPYYINSYAHKLQTLPYGLLWVVRFVLLAAVVVHAWTGIVLAVENRKARPATYKKDATVQASLKSRTMIWTGLIVAAFIAFHIAHYTVRSIPGHEYNEAIVFADGSELPAHVYLKHGEEQYLTKAGDPLVVHDVYNMMVAGFSYWWISAFYLVAVYLLAMHLGHGVSSMFQSMGWRNESSRRPLELFGVAFGWIVFLGFAAVPLGVLFGIVEPTALPYPEPVMAAHP